MPATGVHDQPRGTQLRGQRCSGEELPPAPLAHSLLAAGQVHVDAGGHDAGDPLPRRTEDRREVRERRREVVQVDMRWGGEDLDLLVPRVREGGQQLGQRRTPETRVGADRQVAQHAATVPTPVSSAISRLAARSPEATAASRGPSPTASPAPTTGTGAAAGTDSRTGTAPSDTSTGPAPVRVRLSPATASTSSSARTASTTAPRCSSAAPSASRSTAGSRSRAPASGASSACAPTKVTSQPRPDRWSAT